MTENIILAEIKYIFHSFEIYGEKQKISETKAKKRISWEKLERLKRSGCWKRLKRAGSWKSLFSSLIYRKWCGAVNRSEGLGFECDT